ncbi:MAG: Ig-like domain-containing protein [Clostridia bacterium]|nr:Ig-like domain-containing protein [Clostridia bacterium]
MSITRKLIMTVLTLCLVATIAYADDWSSAYLDGIPRGMARVIGLCDINGDGVPELVDICAKSRTSTLAIKYMSSGSAKTLQSSDFDFSGFSIAKLKAAKLVLRENAGGDTSLFIRLLGANDDVRLAFSPSGTGSLTTKLNIRKSTSNGTANYYVNSSAAKFNRYSNALKAFTSEYSKSVNVAIKTISASDGNAAIKKKFNALAKAFKSDAKPTSITLADTTATLYAGETHTLAATFSPSGTTSTITWSSSAPKVATVTQDGLVTALSAGTANIVATTANGLTARCKITVSAKEPVIVDISQHNYSASMDWAKIAKNVDLLILRCGVTRTYTQPLGIGTDERFAYYAKMCAKYDIPFGVYYYGKCSTVAEAKQEAQMTWDTASSYNPLFYVYDAEESRLTKKLIETYMKTLQSLGAKKTGYYIAHHLYGTYNLDTSLVDFIWIPRYSGNEPAYACDMHQYTSTGTVAGFPGVVDMNRLTGTKSLKWFLK